MDRFEIVHNYAIKYKKLYADPKTLEREVDNGFDRDSIECGFMMDGGEAFIKAFSKEAFYSNDTLLSIIDNVNDVDLLGSAIFSRWRYVTHWGQSDLTGATNRPWFLTAFSRLAAITE